MRISLILLMCLVLTACSPLENNARDTAAALSGSIVAAQGRYQGSCTADPSKDICKLINRGVSGENALITSIETYCGWAVSIVPPDPNQKCVPVKSAEAALVAAIQNATTMTIQIKGAL